MAKNNLSDNGEWIYRCFTCGDEIKLRNALLSEKYPFWIYCSESCKDKGESGEK